MFGRRRKAEKMPADLILTATTSTTIDSSVLTQLQSRSHGLTPAHKALLATTLCSLPAGERIHLAQAAQSRGGRAAGANLPTAGIVATATGDGPTLEDQLDANFSQDDTLLGTLSAVFEHQHWPYQVQGDALVTAAEGLPVLYITDEELRIIHLFVPMVPGRGSDGYVPIKPDAELSAAVYLLAADFRLPYGAFTRDNRDGEIRYESSLLVADAKVSDEQIAGMMVMAVAALAQHGPTVLELLKGRTSLKQALARLDPQPNIQIA